MPLSDEQVDRYSRQIILPEVGGAGQERLLAAKVHLLGTGAIAAWAVRYLVAAGVGDLSSSPAVPAELVEELAQLNPDCRISTAAPRGDRCVALAIDSAVDAIEPFWEEGAPILLAECRARETALTALWSRHPASACPRCSRATTSAPRSSSAGTFIAALAVTEAIKLILDVGTPLFGKRLTYAPLAHEIRTERVTCNPGCPEKRA